MTQNADKLNDLIQILRDGRSFYQDAAAKVVDPSLRTLFHDMAATRAAVIVDLAAEVRMEGETPADSGTVTGGLRKIYGDVLAAMASDKDSTYVNQLEAAEDRLMHAFTAALNEADIARVTDILNLHMPKIRRMHDLMRQQKQQRAAA
jgi:uncharacterized protein (TIGR02284 family)